MQATLPATASPERAAAMLRLDLRDALAEMLGRIVPGYVTVLRGDGCSGAEAELFPTDAREAASDLVEELEARGFVVGRARP